MLFSFFLNRDLSAFAWTFKMDGQAASVRKENQRLSIFWIQRAFTVIYTFRYVSIFRNYSNATLKATFKLLRTRVFSGVWLTLVQESKTFFNAYVLFFQLFFFCLLWKTNYRVYYRTKIHLSMKIQKYFCCLVFDPFGATLHNHHKFFIRNYQIKLINKTK